MPYLSVMLGKRIRSDSGQLLGRLKDVIVEPSAKFPIVTGIEVATRRGRGRRPLFISWPELKEWRDECLVIRPPSDGYVPGEGEVFLARDLLDKQMVDMDGYRIVRVSDIRLAWSGRQLRVIGADVGVLAILRRLGLSSVAERLRDVKARSFKEKVIPWNLVSPVEPMPYDVRLNVPYRDFLEKHPSDIADIIEQLDVEQRARVLALVDDPKAAEVLPQVLPVIRSSIARSLDEERLSDLLEIMPPDEAADILGSLSREKAQQLLSLMGIDEASVVADLLGYEPSTAGGRMTTEFIAVPDYMTAEQTIELLREKGSHAETIYYMYVVDGEGHLSGVLSLRDLLRAPVDDIVGQLMTRDVITADVDEDQEAVAERLGRYNLLAVPVVDSDHVLKGIVTVDDAIDVIREESSEDFSQLSGVAFEAEGTPVKEPFHARRWAGIMLTFLGGIVATSLFALFKGDFIAALPLIYFVPVTLRASHDVSVWSLAMSVSEASEKSGGGALLARFMAREYLNTITAALIVSGLAFGLALLWTGSWASLAAGAAGLFAAIALAGLLGLVVPMLIRRVKLDPVLGPGRLVGVLVMVASLLSFLAVSGLLLNAWG